MSLPSGIPKGSHPASQITNERTNGELPFLLPAAYGSEVTRARQTASTTRGK